MKQQKRIRSFRFYTTIDMDKKEHRDYWTRRWGVSVHQLRAAVRAVNSNEVKLVEQYLKDKDAI